MRRTQTQCHGDNSSDPFNLKLLYRYSIWPLALERELKIQPAHPKMLSLRPSLGCQLTSFSRFVKSSLAGLRSQALLSVQRSTHNLGIWISGTFGPLATCSDYQGSASYSHEPLIVVFVEARSTRLLSNA